MTDLTQIPNLSDVLQKTAYFYGRDIQLYVDAKTAAERAYADQKFAAMAGEDTRINAMLDTFLKIVDAEPGTPEFQEGQNLYTLIESKYASLVTRVTKNENDIALLQQFATQTTQDVAAYMTAVNKRIDDEITRAKAAEADLQVQITTLKNQAESDKSLTTQELTALNGKITTLNEQMTARQNEIATLNQKNADFLSRIEIIEVKFVGFSADAAIGEFRRGLNGQASAFGNTYTPAV